MRTLIKDIVLTSKGGQLKIDVRGDLAGILTIAQQETAVGNGPLC
jgi:hypothetical protein